MSNHASNVTLAHRPADRRGVTDIGWLRSFHSFSFGQYQDHANTHYSVLRVINDDIISPGQGFGQHPHRDMEIVTWVLSGTLRHGDNLGNMADLVPGQLQAMSAGTGIEHSEFNASKTEPAHLLQIWLFPSEKGIPPRYDQKTFDPAARLNRWDTLAAGEDFLTHAPDAMPIHQNAAMRVVDLAAGESVDVQITPGRHHYLHLATGQAMLDDRQQLIAGDAATLEGQGRLALTTQAGAQALWFDLP